MNNFPLTNYHMTLYEKQNSKDMFISNKYCLYRIKLNMMDNIRNYNKSFGSSRLKFEKIFTYDKSIGQLKKKFDVSVENYINFWDSLNSQNRIDACSFQKICTNLVGLKKEILVVYKFIYNSITNKSYQFLGYMCLYSRYIAFDDLLLNEILTNIQGNPCSLSLLSLNSATDLDIEAYLHKTNMLSISCCCISISFNLENLGIIKWTSENSTKIFGTPNTSLIHRNVNCILPTPISKVHDHILRRFFFRGESKLLNKTNLLWAKDDQGKCFSLLLNLKIFLEATD